MGFPCGCYYLSKRGKNALFRTLFDYILSAYLCQGIFLQFFLIFSWFLQFITVNYK